MSKTFFSKLNFILILSCIFLFSSQGWGGTTGPRYPNIVTDGASSQLYFFWDRRDRESFFQVYNSSSLPIIVHIQVFSTTLGCTELDFFDNFTGEDTHIYNLSSLDRNDETPLPISEDFDNQFGFVVVSVVDSIPGNHIDNPVLLGSIRVTDNAGYELRTNPAGYPTIGVTTEAYSLNFDDFDESTFSDVVGIAVTNAGPGHSAVLADEFTLALFDPQMFNEHENVTSCPRVAFRCGATSIFRNGILGSGTTLLGFDLGLNDSIPSSKTSSLQNNICISVPTTKGLLRFQTQEIPDAAIASGIVQADFFVGFIGLNNGINFGTMESFTASP